MTAAAAREPVLFTFAIVSDTHVRPPGGDQSSPFPVNLKANGRARFAVAEIARHAPALTFHLGDMVHPMPSLPTFRPAAAEARRILAPLAPLHYVPGNHDLGDKPLKGLPAEFASEASLALYTQEFGPPWGVVRYGGCRFVVVAASLINRGIAAEDAQWQWLEGELGGSPERTFLFIHYPPFITAPDEPSHYDNIDEPGRSRLLGLVGQAGVEAVFSGHVHHVFYNRLGATQLYVLPPTSFTRQDYAELFPVEPADEFGRDDRGKYGFALVDVLAEGHRVRIVPTEGHEAGEGDATPATAASGTTAGPRGDALVAHLRHAWATPVALPYNGPMEEFSRKRARNDLLLVRLWQMGIRRLRTPLADLLDPQAAARMADFHAAGLRFTVFTLTVPDPASRDALAAAAPMLDALQVVTSRTDLADIADALAASPPFHEIPLIIGKLHSSADEPRHGSHFAHSVTFGFKWFEREAALAALVNLRARARVDGIAFQVPLEDELASRLSEIDALGRRHDLAMTANIRLSDDNPAVANFDDERILARVQAAVAAAPELDRTTIELDTLIDVDRGYHPRHGLLDRRCNLRAAGRWLAGLGENSAKAP
ncbi:MAG: metallophosphoesterase [Hyphomicrobiaceae bacterium]